MYRMPFNEGWGFRTKTNRFAELTGAAPPLTDVILPHDAMLTATRSPNAEPANGYFPGGHWEYQKTFHISPEYADKALFLHFEGVYRDALVSVNGVRVAHRPFGYTGFSARIDHVVRPGEDNVVHVDAVAGDDSRWYSGAGIYREVHLVVGEPVRVALDGLRITTVSIDRDHTVIEVATVVENDSTRPEFRTVTTTIAAPNGSVVAQDRTVVTAWPDERQRVRQRISLDHPLLWSIDEPHLHTCTVTLSADEATGDTASTTFGIRTVAVDAASGLRINGEEITLRGACVHHDNGILGSATVARAEERRVELLKHAGFNALRSAHNPMSEAMLAACDRLGMLVMDEAFDTWTEPKSTADYARSFERWWRDDLTAMVAKDYNHPSVICYSIGNEIPELGRSDGARRARALAEHVRSLDSTRFTTMGVNPTLACGMEPFADPDAPPMPDLGVNSIMTLMQDYLPTLLRSPIVDTMLEESFAAVDVAGYNYLETRYELDAELHPGRVIVGTETMPALIGRHWHLVRDNPHVIGDFTWTGWDYLGEAGIGRIDREGNDRSAGGINARYPALTGGAGDLDITGFRRPTSYLREIVYGLRQDPYIAVQDPASFGVPIQHQSPWILTDAVASWSWTGAEGKPVVVEVYADADEVELLVSGAVVGRKPAGEAVEYRAVFETTYLPGTVEAVAYRDGRQTGRFALTTAGPQVHLTAESERDVIGDSPADLAFVQIALVDDYGIVHHGVDRPVQVTVDGPGVLIGLGSAASETEESFLDDVHDTYQGRALAVIRPTGCGPITVTVTTAGCVPAMITVTAGNQ